MSEKSAIGVLKAALSSTLVAGLVFGACWGAAITWWRADTRVPVAGDVILYLFLLPLGLLRVLWGGRQLRAEHVATAATASASAPAPAPKLALPHAPVLAILAASLRLPHGPSVPALAAALAGKRAGAAPDPELVDEAGHPLITARSSAADDAALRAEIQAWLAANGLAELRFSDEQWRALVLATQVTAELAGQAVSLLMPAGDRPLAPRALRLIPLLPADWDSAQRRAAGHWLEHTVAQAGWPAARIERIRSTLPGPDEASPAAPLGHLAHEAVLTNAPLSALVVACASQLGGASLARWAAQGRVFGAAQPHGRVPGEGAAGLLVLDERQARTIEGAASVRLDALREARRATSADAEHQADPQADPRTGPALLAGLIDTALAHAGAAPADVAMVVADTGAHGGRGRELLDSVAALPRLDPEHGVARVGIACGSCGVVSFIAALALARHHALARAAPVLCVSNEDAYRRIAALVGPASRAAQPAPSSSSVIYSGS
jgi:hypothetical protein